MIVISWTCFNLANTLHDYNYRAHLKYTQLVLCGRKVFHIYFIKNKVKKQQFYNQTGQKYSMWGLW